MRVNLDEYRGAVRAFNIYLLCKNIFINIFIRKLDILPFPNAFLSKFQVFSMFLLFYKSFCFTVLLRKNIKIINILLLRIFHIYKLVIYVFHIRLYLILTKRNGDIKQNPGPKSNSSQSFLFFTGILIVFLRIISSKYLF